MGVIRLLAKGLCDDDDHVGAKTGHETEPVLISLHGYDNMSVQPLLAPPAGMVGRPMALKS